VTVVNVSKPWSGESSSLGIGEAQRQLMYDVIATPTPGLDVIAEIEGHGSIPQRGAAHPNVPGRWVTGVETRRSGGPNRYLVTVTYETRQPVVPTVDPVAMAGWWDDMSWEVVERAADIDYDDAVVGSSAGEPFDPPLTEQVPFIAATWVKNFTAGTATLTWLEGWANAVNTNTISGVAAAGELRIFPGPIARRMPAADGAPAYDQVRFPIQLRRGAGGEGWYRRVVDRGTRERVGTEVGGAPKLRMIIDEFGDPISQPVLLNGSGVRLPAAGTPVVLAFRLVREVNMSALGIVAP